MRSPRDRHGPKVEDPKQVLADIKAMRAKAGTDWPTAAEADEPDEEPPGLFDDPPGA